MKCSACKGRLRASVVLFTGAGALAGCATLLDLAAYEPGGRPLAEGGSSSDAQAEAEAGASVECFDLAREASGFASRSQADGGTTTTSAGLEITYPANAPGRKSVALWHHALTVPKGVNAATIAVEGRVELPNPLPVTAWHLSLAGLLQGEIGELESAPFVELSLASSAPEESAIQVSTFQRGSAQAGGPTTQNDFDALTVGTTSTKVFLGVEWSTNVQASIAVALQGRPPQQLMAQTSTVVAPVGVWTLILGGTASSNPGVKISFARVCVTLQPRL